MQVKEGERTSGGATRAAIFLFWVVILILAHLSFSSTKLDQNIYGRLHRSPPRRARFLAAAAAATRTRTKAALFHAPPRSSLARSVDDINGGDPNELYGNEKRLIHTGPNPLHN